MKALKSFFRRVFQKFTLYPLIVVQNNSDKLIKESLATIDPKSVLDVGCGDQVNRQFVKGKYIGLDYPSNTAERSLKSKKADVWGDARALPFEDESFDMVLATCVLEHIYEKERVVQESFRVLKNNGHFLLTVPQCYRTHEAPYDFHRFTKFGIQKLLIENGFSIIKIMPSNKSELLTAWYLAVDALSQPEVRLRRLKLILLAVGGGIMYLLIRRHSDVENKEHPLNWFILAKKQ